MRHLLQAFAGLLLLAGASSGLARECVSVVAAGGGYGFWGQVKAGAEQAGRDLNIDVYFRGPNDEADSTVQIKFIDAFLEKHCRVFVIAPASPQVAQRVNELKRRGIATVYIDRDMPGSDVAGIVSTDNFKAGQLAGQMMALELNGKGKVAVLRLKKGIPSTDQREAGFIESAKSAGLDVVVDQYIGSGVGEARANAARILGQLRVPVDGVFTPNESTTYGVISALQDLGRKARIVHIGFDLNDFFRQSLQTGGLYGVVVQRPFEIGYTGVTMAYRVMNGEKPDNKNIDTGVSFVTRKTFEQTGASGPLPLIRP
ncbi:ABC transporter substrate-binding protein [Andreprevotia chitinilytica]|uniref:ABC transporter substrate-binding protein n=1 Tax=Andreprevotia chitinilytica TaxID=396808 RepID=UPI00068C3236|nr:substrate-binding domain-containing protein [Andreprevotia chitinilytica]